jgi:hypothetical protein
MWSNVTCGAVAGTLLSTNSRSLNLKRHRRHEIMSRVMALILSTKEGNDFGKLVLVIPIHNLSEFAPVEFLSIRIRITIVSVVPVSYLLPWTLLRVRNERTQLSKCNMTTASRTP